MTVINYMIYAEDNHGDTEAHRGRSREQRAKGEEQEGSKKFHALHSMLHAYCSSPCLCVSVVVLTFLLILASASVLAEEVFLFSKPLSGVYLRKGDTEERIIYRQGPYIAPRLAPEGENSQKMLFHSRRGGEIGIWLTYIWDLEGKEIYRLCDGDQANWSFDSRRIVYRREGMIMEREIASDIETIITPEDWLSCEFPKWENLPYLSRQQDRS